jgi:hypothetical protein
MTNESFVSVDYALQKANREIKYPALVLFLVLFTGVMIWAVSLHKYWLIGVGFVSAAAAMLIYSGIMTTKWKIWAFTHVQDIEELKIAAISEKLLPDEEEPWQEKLLIKSATDKIKLKEIDERLLQLHNSSRIATFTDDPSVAEITNIYESNIMVRAMGFIGLVLGLSLLFVFLYVGLFVIVAATVAVIYDQKVSRPQRSNPTIVLSNKGIETYSAGVRAWGDITNEEVKFFSRGKNSYAALVYDYPGGSEEIDIDYLKTNVRSLNHLIYVYRKRYEQRMHSIN